MQIIELFNRDKCLFALEVFPPKRQSRVESIYQMLGSLGEIPADYISVTYSAGGSGAKEYTAQIARHLREALGVLPLAHLTCANARQDEVEAELHTLREAGVENILALRGDRTPDSPPCEDFAHASDLMRKINQAGGFYTAGACYPEGHPDSHTLAADIDSLMLKLQAGAGHFISQMFFDNNKFYRFLNLARRAGITCPVEAGIMPIVKYEQIPRVVALSSASLPAGFSKWVTRWADDPASFRQAGIDYAVRQIRQLIENGADGIHLYAMNDPAVAAAVYRGIADLL